MAIETSAQTCKPAPEEHVGRDVAAWIGLLAGPIAWVLHLQTNYALVPWVCLTKRRWVLPVVTIVFLAVALAGGIVSWGLWRKEGREWPSGAQDGKPGTRRLMAALGLMTSALFFLTMVGQGIATFFIDPCQD